MSLFVQLSVAALRVSFKLLGALFQLAKREPAFVLILGAVLVVGLISQTVHAVWLACLGILLIIAGVRLRQKGL